MLSELQIRPHVCSPRPLPHQLITWRVSKVHGRRVFPLSSSRRENIISLTLSLRTSQWPSTSGMICLLTSVSQLQRPRYRAHAMVAIITASFCVPQWIHFNTTYLKSTQVTASTNSCATTNIGGIYQ